MRNFLRKLLIITLELIVISGALWYVAEKRGISKISQIVPAVEQSIGQKVKPASQQTFPQLAGPIVKKYSWKYKSVSYEISQTLYQSVFDFYGTQAKTFSYSGDLPVNWQEQYYAMFFDQSKNDQTIKDLTAEIKKIGQSHNLADDQIVELALSFVQSIPYDDGKATQILAGDPSAKMNYPYEVLFENKGVCSDKSILAVSILRELGYGTALFVYEKENHMAIGIQCPKDYSTYSSGYCYGETTSIGNRIGIIPEIDPTNNKTVGGTTIAQFGEAQDQQQQLNALGQVQIFEKISGKEYRGIIATTATNNEIDALQTKLRNLQVQLKTLKNTVVSEESSLKLLQNKLDGYKKDNDVTNFNKTAEIYNDQLETYKKDVKKYNDSVKLYNQAVERYNILIKQ